MCWLIRRKTRLRALGQTSKQNTKGCNDQLCMYVWRTVFFQAVQNSISKHRILFQVTPNRKETCFIILNTMAIQPTGSILQQIHFLSDLIPFIRNTFFADCKKTISFVAYIEYCLHHKFLVPSKARSQGNLFYSSIHRKSIFYPT